MKRIAFIAALLAFAGHAWAQTTPVPQISAMSQTDAVQVVPKGVPSAQSVYAPPGGIAGIEQYAYSVPVTGFSIVVPKFVALVYINPATTPLATGTLTMPVTPGDGQKVCLEDTGVVTALTVSANTGQSMLTSIGLGALTATVANTKYCWFFNAPLAGWIRTQ